ncbi:MAG: DUF3822 family protein [Bacteroidales bacterium]|nr:DUF3822 family protein [Bacteroidales bacterium]
MNFSITGKNFLSEVGNSHLSLEIRLDGFSFCIIDLNKNKFIALECHDFKDVKTFSYLSEIISEKIKTKTLLKIPFKSVSAAFVNNKSTLVPSPLFDSQNIKNHISFSDFVDFNSETVKSDKLRTVDAHNVYAIPENIEKIFTRHFSNIKILHFSSCLIDNIISQNLISNSVFVNVYNSHFEIVVAGIKNLTFYNTFKYQAKEDVLYYLLFTLEQLNLKPETARIVLSGLINNKTSLYKLISGYFANLEFAKLNDALDYSELKEKINPNYFFNLANQHLCVL